MVQELFDWFGTITDFGVDPALASAFGFCILLFAVSEFFRLFELLITHITRR